MRRLLATGLIATGLVLTGCAGAGDRPAPGGSAAPAAPPGPSTGPQDPAALIGVWTVAGSSEDAGGVVRAGENSFKLTRDCATLDVQWAADTSGLFVANVGGYSVADVGGGDCPANPSEPAWVTRAVAYRAEGSRRILLDAQGATVAEWVPGDKAPASADSDPADPPPVVSDELRRELRRTATLPAGLAPATPQQLTGRWIPAGGVPAAPRPAHIELTADGDWTGSDGCNAGGGRWVAGATGALLAVSGAQTQIGCANAELMTWFAFARAAGFDGDVLVLVDIDGQESGRLRRAA